MEKLRIGSKKVIASVVCEQDTAIAHKSGGLGVYATPAMVALMEQSAYTLLKEFGEESVGTELEIKHTRACLPGADVRTEAEVTAIEGRKVIFNISAYDNEGIIGEGRHCRFVIDPVRFMQKLKK